MPCDEWFSKFADKFRMPGGEVFGFAAVGFKIVELWISTVVFAEEFPVALAYSQIGQIFVTVI